MGGACAQASIAEAVARERGAFDGDVLPTALLPYRVQRAMLKPGERLLLGVLAVLAVATLFTDPLAFVVVLVLPVVAVTALVFAIAGSVWAWNWRRPRLRRAIARFARVAASAARQRAPVRSWEWQGSVGQPHGLVLHFVVETDADRERLLGDAFDAEIQQLLQRDELSTMGVPSVRIEAHSQQTVDRDHGGSWMDYQM